MVEKKSRMLKKTVFGNVSGHNGVYYKSQVSVDYTGDYDIPTKNAQGKW